MVYESEIGQYEVINANERYDNLEHNLKLLISFHKVEFSYVAKGYYRLTRDIFISGLPFLLYIKNVTLNKGNSNFEMAKEKARSVLLQEIEEQKISLTRSNRESLMERYTDSDETRTKVELLDQAMSILQKA